MNPKDKYLTNLLMQENTAKLCAKLSKNLKGCFYYEDTQIYVAKSKQMN